MRASVLRSLVSLCGLFALFYALLRLISTIDPGPPAVLRESNPVEDEMEATKRRLAALDAQEPISTSPYPLWDYRNAVNGPPTPKFRDNLKNDTKYITTWSESAGFSEYTSVCEKGAACLTFAANDVIAIVNLLHIARESGRVPIIPPFSPAHHMTLDAPFLPFGEVFDIPRLAKALGRPVLEWHQVKQMPSAGPETLDLLGCWTIWMAQQWDENYPRHATRLIKYQGLDISYTLAPATTKLIPNYVHDKHSKFWSLVALTFPQYAQRWIITTRDSPINKVKLRPDEQLACFDYLYYVTTFKAFEFAHGFDYNPQWRLVGRHLHFNPRLVDIADQYLRRVFKTPPGEPTPKYIAVHARRTDFKDWCRANTTLADCFPDKNVIGRRVQEIRNEYERTKQWFNLPVIILSEDNDEKFWNDMRSMGYWRIDHSETVQNYNKWYPVLIDQVIQAGGVGFVGMSASTMSALAKMRTDDWNSGITKMMKWGFKGADNH